MNSTTRSSGPSPHAQQQRIRLTEEGAHLPKMFGFDFISAPNPDGVFILASKHRAAVQRTAALVYCSALNQPRQIVERCFGTLGCDLVLVICPDLKSVADMAARLSHPPPPQSKGRIGLITYAAWQMLSSAEPSAPPTRKTLGGTRRDQHCAGGERFRP